jgi:quercetin dioxygenase-like cupin family protein
MLLEKADVPLKPLLIPALLCTALATPAWVLAADPPYAYATNGVLENIEGRLGVNWKVVLDESNLGGKELEVVEATFPAGMTVGSHPHRSVEIIYVLSGVYEHEVNGKLFRLKPGMVGIVRPGDTVRHLVPKDGDAKVLILWAPAGEAARVVREGKGTVPAPVPEATR